MKDILNHLFILRNIYKKKYIYFGRAKWFKKKEIPTKKIII